MARELAGGQDRTATIGYGTLYRALDRLEWLGYLTSWWAAPSAGGLPRRRLYQVTPAGVAALNVFAEPAPVQPEIAVPA
jgi:DNA-binding PadR family transcriptional regulator